MLMSLEPPSASEAKYIHQINFDTDVKAGRLRPIVFPYVIYAFLLVGGYLLIPHTRRPWLHHARWLVYTVSVCWNIKVLRECSSTSMGAAFGVGLVCLWGIFWAAKWLLVERVQEEWKRVEQMPSGKTEKAAVKADPSGPKSNKTTYYWQSYPEDSWSTRLSWVTDLLLSCRHAGWNQPIPQLPSMPPQVLARLGEPITKASQQDQSYVGLRRYDTQSALNFQIMRKLVVDYLLLDLILTQMRRDHYFILGPSEYPSPPHLAFLSTDLLTIYRQILACTTLVTALDAVFALSPLFFSIIPTSLPSLFRHSLRMEPYYYPDSWGSPRFILTKGLAGVWGGFWHQVFRFVFVAPQDYLIIHGYLAPRSLASKLCGLFLAFTISGIVHAAGSSLQYPPTKPWQPFTFFILQGIGICVQSAFCASLKTQIHKLPLWLRRTGNLCFVLYFGHMTGNLILDDLARGGLFMIEPWPYSIFRGLGWGHASDGWRCWQGVKVQWYTGTHWWESGLLI